MPPSIVNGVSFDVDYAKATKRADFVEEFMGDGYAEHWPHLAMGSDERKAAYRDAWKTLTGLPDEDEVAPQGAPMVSNSDATLEAATLNQGASAAPPKGRAK